MAVLIKITGSGNGVLKSIAEAIGEPAAPKDKKERLAEIIDNAQTDIASLCNEKGCNIPVHPTFPEIVTGLNKVTHFLQSAQISSLSAQIGFSEPGKMALSWKNPVSDQNYSGVMIRYKAGSYPASQTDGTLIYDSNGTLPASETATVTGLSDGTSYYVRGFAYAISGASRIYTTSTTGAQCTAIPRQLKGQQIFTASSIFTVPYGVTSVDVFLVGGGASGANNGEMGGGAGYTKTIKGLAATQGQSVSVVIGAGGNSSIASFGEGIGGGQSSFDSYVVVGGNAYLKKDSWQYPKGGSGGGGIGGKGGADGSDGYYSDGDLFTVASGQHTTTRAFGETSNTLYAGGGGGASQTSNISGFLPPGVGGVGGGGTGSNGERFGSPPASYGTSNTGGGGGGGLRFQNNSIVDVKQKGGNGGSGIVIVRWGY